MMQSDSDQMDDLYAGFSQQQIGYENLMFYAGNPIGSVHGKDFYGSGRLPTGTAGYSRGNLTSQQRILIRPDTAMRPVGYTSEAGRQYDGMMIPRTATRRLQSGIGERQSGGSHAPRNMIVSTTKKETAEEKYKLMEEKINALLEQSILLATSAKTISSSEKRKQQTELMGALTKAKETVSLDRELLRMRDHNGNTAFHNFELTFSVLFNLATLYELNGMYVEALNTYQLMIKNKMFATNIVNRLKLNMGNIYYQLGLYSKAIKLYRMAIDQIPKSFKEIRLKITHNIGCVFIKMGQFSDAAVNFEFIMTEQATIVAGLHLILCYYALGDMKKLKRAFQLLLDVPATYMSSMQENGASAITANLGPEQFDDYNKLLANITNLNQQQYIIDAVKTDEMYGYDMKWKKLIERNIMITANLISGVIDENFEEGYAWCIEVIKNSSHPQLANELELNKGVLYLKQTTGNTYENIQQAIETFKYYEKNQKSIAINAVINLTFIYAHLKDIKNACNYAELAMEMDSYNPATYINLGCCEMLFKGDLERAKYFFEQALKIDSTQFEGIYNLGLIAKKQGDFGGALQLFRKLYGITTTDRDLSGSQFISTGPPASSMMCHQHVLYQIANLYEVQNDYAGALEFYTQLMGMQHQLDSGILNKIAEMYEREGDNQQSYQYNMEALRILPTNLQLLTWLGSHFIEMHLAEKSIGFYERAALSNPTEIYFFLRIAGCHRRIGNAQKAFTMFQDINKQFPDNMDCLRALIHLSGQQGDLDLKEFYQKEFQRLEKQAETRQRIGSSSNSSGGSRPTTTAPLRQKSANKRSGFTNENPNGSGSDKSLSNNGIQGFNPDEATMSTATLNYADPLGPPPERPKTGRYLGQQDSLKEESDDDLDTDKMLPI